MIELPELPTGVRLSAYTYRLGDKVIEVSQNGYYAQLAFVNGGLVWSVNNGLTHPAHAFITALHAALDNGATYEDVVKFYDPIPF